MQFGYRLEFLKSNFFDRAKVMNSLNPVKRKALGRFGGLTRKIARNSIKTSSDISNPGDPPKGHTGHLKKMIVYALDTVRSSVIIGPSLFNQPIAERPMGALEYGGWSRSAVPKVTRKWKSPTEGRKIYIRARPFMHPAFNKAAQDLPKIWREARQ